MHGALRAICGVSLSAAVVLIAPGSKAGANDKGVEYCTTFSGGGGECYGSYAGFLGSSNSTDYAEFGSWYGGSSGPYNYFYASYNGAFFSCTNFPGSSYAAVSAGWPSMLASDHYFYVTWDSSGNCNTISAYTASCY